MASNIEKLLAKIEENTRGSGGGGGGGGSDIFVAHFEVTWDEGTQSAVVTCDKTAAEIAAAGDAGKLIIGKALMYQTEPAITMLNVVAYTYNGNPHANFEYINIWPNSEIGAASSDDILELGAIYWDGTGWYCHYSDYQLTPTT